MTLTVKKGSHRFRPSWPWLVFRKHMSYTVTFLPSCRYDIGADQKDWNKLFGVGFFPHHHRNSYRFAWRYDPEYDVIQIGAYWYYEGERRSSVIGVTSINGNVKLTLDYNGEVTLWRIDDKVAWAIVGNWPMIGYKLGAYFGGNRSAPNDIKIKISKNA